MTFGQVFVGILSDKDANSKNLQKRFGEKATRVAKKLLFRCEEFSKELEREAAEASRRIGCVKRLKKKNEGWFLDVKARLRSRTRLLCTQQTYYARGNVGRCGRMSGCDGRESTLCVVLFVQGAEPLKRATEDLNERDEEEHKKSWDGKEGD